MGILSGVVDITSDVQKAASDTIQTGVRKGTSPLSVLGVGGAGAWAYTEREKTQREEERTDRYTAYQRRLTEIENRFNRGEISRTRMKDLKEKARQDYYNSDSNPDNDNPNGLTLTQLINQMGTMQTLAAGGIMALVVYYVLRPLASKVQTGTVSLEEIFG